MVGYVVVLISFPVQMSAWASPRGLAEVPGITETFRHLFSPTTIDAVTAATPLDLLRQNTGLLFDDLLTSSPELTGWGGIGWFEVNLAFLLGGAWLLYRRVFTWHAPVAMIVAKYLKLPRSPLPAMQRPKTPQWWSKSVTQRWHVLQWCAFACAWKRSPS